MLFFILLILIIEQAAESWFIFSQSYPAYLTTNKKTLKMKKILTLMLGLVSYFGFAQQSFEIPFSKNYKAILKIDKGYEDEIFKKGSVTIYNTKNNQLLFSIDADELTYELDQNGQVETQKMELPYGEQSIIIYEDFNFDGKKDLAVMDGQFSCYHGPSYQIYLETGKGLEYNSDFTDLAQNYCGMFYVNTKNQTIEVMTKSGCCWHEYSIFKIVNNIPVPISITEQGISANGLFLDIKEQKRVNNKMTTRSYSQLFEESMMDLLFGFTLSNGKKMALYHTDNDQLFYVFINKEDEIEFYFIDHFDFNSKNEQLTFKNKNITYQVSPKAILVTTPTQKTEMKATKLLPNSNWSALKKAKLTNVTMH